VDGAEVTLGFSSGVQRERARVASFRLTRHPVTVADYRSCVTSGGCPTPRGQCAVSGGLLDRSNFDDPDSQDVPLACVLPSEAAAYCAFVGGRLPTVSEWLLAARSPNVQKYAWGNEPPSCSTHPVADGILAEPLSCCAGPEPCSVPTLARVGAHPAGASSAGLEEVLYARGELAVSDASTSLASCGGGTCAVTGRVGAIEGLIPAPSNAVDSMTFRCAFAEAAR
jgi:hypothetical protein